MNMTLSRLSRCARVSLVLALFSTCLIPGASTARAFDPATDYSDGYWSGYNDGLASLAHNCPASESTQYQNGYNSGYPIGIAEALAAIAQDEWNEGYWSGLGDGSAGIPYPTFTTESPHYQLGYGVGYAEGEAYNF